MKYQWIAFIAALAVSSAVHAMSATTKNNYVACRTKTQIENMSSFQQADDRDSFDAYINAGKCFVIKGGHKVTVTDSPGFTGSYTGFVYKGNKLWTTRSALEYGQ